MDPAPKLVPPSGLSHSSELPSPVTTSLGSFSSTTFVNLTGHIIREDDYYSAHGGSADIWKGIWRKDTGNRKVAVKVVRANNENENGHEKMNKRLRKELSVWHKLDHQNILPLLGITFDFGRGNPMGMVCPWVENGNLNGYLGRQNALSQADRFRILCDVADGLSYLHSRDVVHGDLTGSNILIDDKGRALLGDFGLSNVVTETRGPSYITSSIGGSVRWAAPEIFRFSRGSNVSTVSTHGDVYSYGSVMLQVLSGKLPYHQLRRDSEVLIELYNGVHPLRPPQLADEHWALICQCWVEDPRARPNIKVLSERVHHRAELVASGHPMP